MSYASPTLYYQPKNQTFTFAAAMFGAIVAAITASTVIIMSLMHGEIANAMAGTQVSQNGASYVAGTCTSPVTPAATSTAAPAAPAAHYGYGGGIYNSFNTTNNSTVNNTNIHRTKTVKKIDNSETVIIKDNTIVLGDDNTVGDHSGNVVIKDNELNVDSNNTDNTNNSVNTVIDTTVVTVVDNSVTNTDSFNSGISDNEVKL